MVICCFLQCLFKCSVCACMWMFVGLYLCVECVCKCVFVCVWVSVCVWMCAFVCVSVCECVCVNICIWVWMCMCVNVCVSVCVLQECASVYSQRTRMTSDLFHYRFPLTSWGSFSHWPRGWLLGWTDWPGAPEISLSLHCLLPPTPNASATDTQACIKHTCTTGTILTESLSPEFFFNCYSLNFC